MTRPAPLLASLALAVAALLAPAAAPGADDAKLDPQLAEKAKKAVDEGLRFLRSQQADDGSWSKSVGVTGLALRAFLESHRGYTEADGAFVTRPVEFLLYHVQPSGAITESNMNENYNTAVAMSALVATGNKKYAETIASARRYLTGLQIDEGDGYEPDHKYYGGIGYGGDERPDLSNQYMALEALRASALDPKDPAWEKALRFVARCQNRSESNDQDWAGNDGGFTYMPGFSPHGGTASYGSMTHAGLLSLLNAGADKNDPRVTAAFDWIRAHYTLDDNPGARDKQGLFYYYNAFAKALAAYGEPSITDAAGKRHRWRDDLVAKLVSLQGADGSWVNAAAPRWWEGDKNLVTAYTVIALNLALR
jgi:squalene-hopene/tetraprenyl-beta-curcumene cyclase